MNSSALAQQVDWGLREHGMPEIWQRSSGKGVLVIILDTGVPKHDDLAEPLFTENFTTDASSIDRNGHQTHCAGIVAAMNNDAGVVGWAPDVTLAHIKVLNDRGSGRSNWIESGIRYGTDQWRKHQSDFVGCVMSMSLGGQYDEGQERAIVEAEASGIVVVAAAGNSGFQDNGSTVDHPGASQNTIGVAAYRSDGEIARFSSGGPEVDIAMPGEEILSTVPGNRYQVMSGTSMATPAAAGLIACVLSSRPMDQSIRSTSGMREFFESSVDDRGAQGKDDRFGFGVPKVEQLVRDPEFWMF
jgi:subtilisin family serine protease